MRLRRLLRSFVAARSANPAAVAGRIVEVAIGVYLTIIDPCIFDKFDKNEIYDNYRALVKEALAFS